MKAIIEILKHPLISYWSLAFFAYSFFPFILKTWKNRVGYNYAIINKRHYLFGYIGLGLAIVHSLAWLIYLNFPWFGIFSVIFIIVGTIFGYLYKQNRKNKLLLNLHSICYVIGVILLTTHVLMRW